MIHEYNYICFADTKTACGNSSMNLENLGDYKIPLHTILVYIYICDCQIDQSKSWALKFNQWYL